MDTCILCSASTMSINLWFHPAFIRYTDTNGRRPPAGLKPRSGSAEEKVALQPWTSLGKPSRKDSLSAQMNPAISSAKMVVPSEAIRLVDFPSIARQAGSGSIRSLRIGSS
jgi:hypothetical protein